MPILRWCKSGDYWYDAETGAIEGMAGKFHEAMQAQRTWTNAKFTVISDIEPYMSPCGTGVIGSRRERREDLKRNNCREVDPSECKHKYTNPNFALKRGLQLSEA